jgi:hypothetical protein
MDVVLVCEVVFCRGIGYSECIALYSIFIVTLELISIKKMSPSLRRVM